ncbi:MAG: hypothetical protein ABR562_01405 [Thermoplasmatota archaeon]
MSPNTTPASKPSERAWINGIKPKYQSLSITVKDGRVYIGAKGYDFNAKAGGTVSLELDLIGLQNLAAYATQAIDVALRQGIVTADTLAAAPAAAIAA